MTKPLDSHLSQRDAPQPRGGRRPRTWLVALLGFGAADLLVLNLWAVPKLITNTTTTDMRAAQSGETQALAEPIEPAEPQPQAAVVAEAEPGAQPAAAQGDPAAQGAQADLEGQAAVALAAQHGSGSAQQGDSEAQWAARGTQGEGEANPGSADLERDPQNAAAAAQRADFGSRPVARGAVEAHPGSASSKRGAQPGAAVAAQAADSEAQPNPGSAQAAPYAASQGHHASTLAASEAHPSSAKRGEQPYAVSRGQQAVALAARQADPEAQPGAVPAQQLGAATPPPQGDAVVGQPDEQAADPAARAALAAQAPRAEPPPGGAPTQPPQPSEVADLPTDPAVARAFAIRAAQRAMRVALQDRAAVSSNNSFEALTEADQPLTQIFFSLGNYSLGPNGKQLLERKLPLLTSDERPILIVGAADPSGTEQVNEKLSDARAQSVAEWLLAHGVDAQRIQTRAIGHEGAVGSTLDRRVDIWLGGSR